MPPFAVFLLIVLIENPEDLFKIKPLAEDDQTKKGKEDIRETYLKSVFQSDLQIDDHIFVSPGPSKHTRPYYYRVKPILLNLIYIDSFFFNS